MYQYQKILMITKKFANSKITCCSDTSYLISGIILNDQTDVINLNDINDPPTLNHIFYNNNKLDLN